MKKLISFLIVLLLIAVAVFIGSPYYTVYQLKQAYDVHDGDTLVSYIDFEQLQPNIETQLTSNFATTLSQYPMVAQIGGSSLTQTANQFIASAVQRAVTAKNISTLINTQGQANQATKELSATWAISSNQVNLQSLIQDLILQRGDVDAVIKNQVQIMMNKQASELEAHAQNGEDTAKPDLAYCGINCFAVSGKLKGYPVTVELQRNGLFGWKIVDVKLP